MRNEYNAITTEAPEFYRPLVTALEAAGAWQSGIQSDRKGRGTAINVDLYGYDQAAGLAVVQVREAVFRPGRYTRVRKNYFLVGRTESGSPFAHPVDSPARSKSALASPEATVRWVLSRIWDCREEDLEDIERQGDVAFVPVRRLPADAKQVHEGEAVIRDTHRLSGDLWRTPEGTLYTRRGARLVHTKGQHAPVRAKAGLYRVQPGARAETWGFSLAHGD